jgi:cysteine desulfurase
MKRIYFDYAATTPVDERVIAAMRPYYSKIFANTMSFHSRGTEASEAVETSREIISKSLNATPSEIIFTGSATESNNLALKGIAHAYRNKGMKIILSSIEHDCIYETAMYLKSMDYDVVFLKVDKYGFIDMDQLKSEINDKTILVSVIHGNNEIGTIQDIRAIGKLCREKEVFFHTDASQSFGKVMIDVEKDNIDLLTISSHKIYGPKGAAALYIKKGIKVTPLLHGGGHENNLRSSTVNVPAIVGFAKATELIFAEFSKENARLAYLRDKIVKTILQKIPEAILNGHPTIRLSNNVNFSFPFAEGEALLVALDMAGIEVSTGSACSSATLEPSRVIMELGATPVQAHGSLRISLGRFTTEEEVDYLLETLPKVLDKVKKFSPFSK